MPRAGEPRAKARSPGSALGASGERASFGRPGHTVGRSALSSPTSHGGATPSITDGEASGGRYHRPVMTAFLRWLARLGPTNPIAVRVIQGGSRRVRHLYIRTGYLAVLIAVLLWLLLAAGGGQVSYLALAAAGARAFEWSAYLQIGLISLLAPVFMAGAIAQEANPRTWEILLTSPLTASQIVLGNFIGRQFFIFALLLASLPLFALTQYFGGVPGRSIFASYAISMCFALIVGAVAITLSVNRLAGQRAVFTFYICVVSYLALTWAVDGALRGRFGGVTPLTALNPFLALEALLSPSGYPTPDEVALSAMPWLSRMWLGAPVQTFCVLSGALTVIMLGLCVAGVRSLGVRQRRAARRLMGSEERPGRPPRAVWHNPIAWAEAVARGMTLKRWIARWTFIAAGALWGLGIIGAYHTGALDHRMFRFALLATVITEMVVITLIAMNMSATAISREREDGTLDLLLTTPITPSMYLRGKLRGLISYLAPMITVPALTLAAAGLYTLADGLGRAGGVIVNEPFLTGTVNTPVVLPIAVVVAPLVSVGFIAFVVMVGLGWSLKSRGAIGSILMTAAVVAVVTAPLGLCAYQASVNIPYAGPALACLNPGTAFFALVDPARGAEETLREGGVEAVRNMLLVGAPVSLGIFALIVYGMHASMLRGFDMTVRRLAGTR